MRPTRIAGSEPKPLGAPADWSEETHGKCAALFIRREEVDGLPYMRSAWEVDPNEAGLLLAGAVVTLGISGTCHPVVQMGTAQLPEDFEPVVTARRFTNTGGHPMVRVEMLYPHDGVKRGTINVHVDGTLADAISTGVTKIEELAREQGWIK